MINFEIQHPDLSAPTAKLTKLVKFNLGKLTPVRTGRMLAGWEVYNRDNQLRVRNYVPYAGYVDKRLDLSDRAIQLSLERL